jgi:PIN domain nuclease of toxin-antitoxin system
MILLDTHSLVWWVNEAPKLSPPARAAIDAEAPSGQIFVSSITSWEIALLIKSGRLHFTANLEDWLSRVEVIPSVSFVPMDNEIALAAVNLPDDFHKDPADRIIVATARKLMVPIVTADDKIRAYPHVRTIW